MACINPVPASSITCCLLVSFYFSMICDSKIENMRKKITFHMSEIYLFIMCKTYYFCVQHLQINQSSPLSCDQNFKNILVNITQILQSGNGMDMIESIRINRIICASIRACLRIFVTLTQFSIYISFTHTQTHKKLNCFCHITMYNKIS